MNSACPGKGGWNLINEDDVPVMINSELSSLERVLKKNDQICFIRHVRGG